MKKINILLALFTILTLTYSCRKEIEFDEKLIEPKLVVNSFISNDSMMIVSVAASKPIPGVESPQKWIEDATITLFENGKEKETLSPFNVVLDSSLIEYYGEYYFNQLMNEVHSSYLASTQIKIGNTYRLEVSHSDYKSVSCETLVPDPVKIEAVSVERVFITENGWGHSRLNYKLKFKDRPEENNYYRIFMNTVIGRKTENWNTTDILDDSIVVIDRISENYHISSDDPVLNPDEDANDFLFGSPSNRYNLFTDELFEGKEYELSFYTDDYRGGYALEENTSLKEGEFIQVDLYLVSLTRDAYLYLKSSYEQDYNDGGFFAEPVQVYTNIESGAGIFAGYSNSCYKYQQGEFPIDGIEYWDN